MLATSDQTKNVECGIATTLEGSFRCLTPSLCPNSTSILQQVAQLQTQNRKLQAKIESGSCSITNQTSNSKNSNNKTQSNKGRPSSNSSVKTSPNSCAGRCSKPAPLGSCQCNSKCSQFGDCCGDYNSVCKNSSAGSRPPTSKPRATPRPSSSKPSPVGRGADPILGAFTEKIFALDQDNVRSQIQINEGCITNLGNPKDCSNDKLFTSVNEQVFRLVTAYPDFRYTRGFASTEL